ncbi:MAG: transglutaminase domain-containing protein [Myxococcota bacterium]|nr:transglutaminase domain-containing protein [Myxococcota bacterium]
MKFPFIALFAALVSIGCATGSAKHVSPASLSRYFDDASFSRSQRISDPDEILRLNPATVAVFLNAFRAKGPDVSSREWLVGYTAALFNDIEYTDQTYTAQQTWDKKQGNCLSMALLTVALARQLGLSHRFHQLIAPPAWDRQQEMMVIINHINVWIYGEVDNKETATSDERRQPIFQIVSVIDFFPTVKSFPSRPIADKAVHAMFYSNLAAEALVSRDYDRAYWSAKMALSFMPNYPPAWNMLGIVYGHRDHPLTRAVYAHLFELAPEDLSAINNYAIWLNKEGRAEEAATLRRRVQNLRKQREETDMNPFYFFDLAEKARQRARYRHAILLYNEALRRDKYQHEFHFGISISYWMVGQRNLSIGHLQRAIELSTDVSSNELYLKKMMLLSNKRNPLKKL